MEMINKKSIRMASIHDFSKNDKSKGSSSSQNPNQATSVNLATSISHGQDFEGEESDLLINYNELAKEGKFSDALFRDLQIMQILSILNTKNHPNALITGDAGVGKTQIVEEIANRLVKDDPIVCGMLPDVTIYELPLGRIVSGSSYVGQLEEKLYEVLDFAKDPKIILFIDEIHQITGSSESSPTYNKIAQILKPALGRGDLRVIGATTTQEATTFMADPAFSRRWSTVQIPELSPDETSEIIKHIRQSFQKHHDVLLPDDIIEKAVFIGDEYKQYGSHRPDTTITLIDKAMSDARIRRLKLIEESKVNPQLKFIIQNQPKPILTVKQLEQSALALLTGDEKMFKQNADALEKALDETIIGQENAKTVLVDTIRRLSLNLTKRTRPNSFLFAGPSGTGKTEIAKQVTNAVFGSKNRMVYINMSEFSKPESLNRIIGSPDGYVGSTSKRELPFDTLENNPYQVVLLDEFEKAHTDVQRFFMQGLDEGSVKTNRNKEIDFSRAIIIATTNAGTIDMNKNPIGFGRSDENHSKNEIIKMLNIDFDTELLNRFENIVAFTPIEKKDYMKILAVKYNQMIKEVQSNRKDLIFSPDFIEIEKAEENEKIIELADETYTPLSNGRPAERTIREYIENTILDNPNNTQFTLF